MRYEIDESGRAAEALNAEVHTSWTWLPTSSSYIACRVDRPATGADVVGALVIVPPFLRERVQAFRTLRALGLAAATKGFVAINIDLPGDGDSPRALGVDLVTDWQSAVAAAEGLARHLAPGAPVHMVGLRLGACLLPPAGDAAEVRLMWQPVGGRTFSRQQRNARRLAIPVPPVEDGVEFPGGWLTVQDVAALGELRLPIRAGETRGGYRVREEVDRSVADRIALSPTPSARVPFGAIRQIVASLWLGPPATPVEWAPLTSVEIVPGVTETLIAVGPHGLRGVLVVPATARGPMAAVAFTAMGSEVSSGPGDLWVGLARSLAAQGVASLRADRRGLGEAFFPADAGEAPCYTDDAVADTEALLARLRAVAGAAPVAAVGVCAGAWCFLRAGSTTRIDRIVAVNPFHWSTDTSLYDDKFYRLFHSENLDVEAPASGAAGGARLRVTSGWVRRKTRYVLGVWSETYRGDRIGRALRPLRAYSRVDVLVGPRELRRYLLKGGGLQAARPGVRVVRLAQRDHSLLSERARSEVARYVEAAISELTAAPSGRQAS